MDHVWTAVQACVWIATQDDARVAEMLPTQTFAEAYFVVTDGGAENDEARSLMNAREKLGEWCRKGTLVMHGRKRGEGDIVEVPSASWNDFAFRDELRRGVSVVSPASGEDSASWWDTLRVNARDVKSAWEAEQASAVDGRKKDDGASSETTAIEPIPDEYFRRLGPAIFGQEWIDKLGGEDRWIIQDAAARPQAILSAGEIGHKVGLATFVVSDPISREQLAAAKKRRRYMEHQRVEVRRWIEERHISTVQEFEDAFGRTFGASAQIAADPGSILSLGQGESNHGSQRTPEPYGAGNRAYTIDDALVERALKARKDGQAKSYRDAAQALAVDIPGGGTSESKVRRIARKAAKADKSHSGS